MNKKFYNLSWTIISMILGVFVLSGAFAIGFRWDEFRNQYFFEITLQVFIYVSLLILMIILLSLTKKGKGFWNKFSDYQKIYRKDKLESQIIPKLVDYDYSAIEEYDGKNIFIYHRAKLFMWVSIVCSVIIGLIVFVVVDSIMQFLVLWIVFTAICIGIYSIDFFSKRVGIDETGVHQLRIIKDAGNFEWNSIKTIGITTNVFGYRTPYAYIYVSTKELKYSMSADDCKDESEVIMFKFRPEALHCIIKYYKGDIIGAEMNVEWAEYLNNQKNI